MFVIYCELTVHNIDYNILQVCSTNTGYIRLPFSLLDISFAVSPAGFLELITDFLWFSNVGNVRRRTATSENSLFIQL